MMLLTQAEAEQTVDKPMESLEAIVLDHLNLNVDSNVGWLVG